MHSDFRFPDPPRAVAILGAALAALLTLGSIDSLAEHYGVPAVSAAHCARYLATPAVADSRRRPG